ncbi:MAG: DUF3313 family protein [Brevundimonas sp.]
MPADLPYLRRMSLRGGVLGVFVVGAAACQSTPASHSGFLSGYDGLGVDAAAPKARRDDVASDAINAVFLQPSILRLPADTPLTAEDQARVRSEVDRQICYEVSERFTILPEVSPTGGTVRTAIVDIHPTNRAGSAVSAAAGFFIPVPLVKFRLPMTTGGLAVETELLSPDGTQVAALTWSRSAEVVGRVDPSLSPVGDALQLAEPMGDAVGDAFSSKTRAVRPIPEPDPCARFGARTNVGRMVASGIVGFGTGLYVPAVAGTGTPETAPETPAAPPASPRD